MSNAVAVLADSKNSQITRGKCFHIEKDSEKTQVAVQVWFGPTTCMLDGVSAAGLAEQAVFWANNFIYKYNKAVKMMERLDKMTLYLQTDLRNRRGSRKRKEEKDA